MTGTSHWTVADIVATSIGAIGGLSGIGAAVSGFTARSANTRASHDRVLALIAESKQSPLADDRHRVGSILHRTPTECGHVKSVTLTDDQVASFFRVLWYFERVDAMYQSLGWSRWPFASSRTTLQLLLLRSLNSAISTWSQYACPACYELVGIGRDSDTRPIPVGRTDANGSARAVIELYLRLVETEGLKKPSQGSGPDVLHTCHCCHHHRERRSSTTPLPEEFAEAHEYHCQPGEG